MTNLRNCLVACGFLAATCFAQNPDGPKFYKLDFTVKDMEGARSMSSRTYSMVAATDGPNSSIRAGSKVPIPSSPGSTQPFSFIELGVNIDCRAIKEVQNELSLNVTADVSSSGQEATPPAYPIIRQNKWSSSVIVPLRKPTLIFSSDDVTTKRQIQLELTATPIK
ncbi:MAG: hypothetical protein M3Y27_26785 [Acidobacteriota bacterium]|nr:hypothetical protein [Acidobacteriota bacterium]